MGPVPSAPDPGSTPRSPAPARALPGACCGSPGTHSPPGRELSGIPSMAEMESAVEGRTASVLFAGFRALGLFSNEVPHVVRYSALKRRFYVTTCVGKSFHTYDVQKLSLVAVSNSVPQDICCMAADGRLVFAAYGNVFSAFARNKEIVHTFKGHKAEIHLLQPFGDHVISVRLPPITQFAAEEARQSDWDGIIACHQGKRSCSTWNYQRSTIGAYFLKPRGVKTNSNLTATAVDITSCGNFAIIGLSSGAVDVYNMQSGIHRGNFGDDKAHTGSVRGVAVDGLNQLVVTAGSERLLKFWNFKSKVLIHSLGLDSSPNMMLLHRDSGILGLAMDDFSIAVLDIETRKIVREFSGHHGQINDMTFSPDGRWLISAAMDCSVRTWDLPSGCLIDCFLLDSAPLNVTMSPTGDFLATSHVDHLGIYLWSNISLYSVVSLRPLTVPLQSKHVCLKLHQKCFLVKNKLK